MIPLKDNVPSERFPIVNTLLIIINALVFIYELSLGPGFVAFINKYGLVPSKFLTLPFFSTNRLIPLMTAMFLHAGWVHIAGNMLFLFIFGDNVEDALGHANYLAFYFLVGALSNLAHIYANASSTVPSIGASGAIAGILGAYIILYPRAKVATLIFLIFFFQIIEVPAYLFLGLWFLIQVISGVGSLGSKATGGVAFWAHIGGFTSGAILLLFFKRKRFEDFLKYF